MSTLLEQNEHVHFYTAYTKIVSIWLEQLLKMANNPSIFLEQLKFDFNTVDLVTVPHLS